MLPVVEMRVASVFPFIKRMEQTIHIAYINAYTHAEATKNRVRKKTLHHLQNEPSARKSLQIVHPTEISAVDKKTGDGDIGAVAELDKYGSHCGDQDEMLYAPGEDRSDDVGRVVDQDEADQQHDRHVLPTLLREDGEVAERGERSNEVPQTREQRQSHGPQAPQEGGGVVDKHGHLAGDGDSQHGVQEEGQAAVEPRVEPAAVDLVVLRLGVSTRVGRHLLHRVHRLLHHVHCLLHLRGRLVLLLRKGAIDVERPSRERRRASSQRHEDGQVLRAHHTVGILLHV